MEWLLSPSAARCDRSELTECRPARSVQCTCDAPPHRAGHERAAAHEQRGRDGLGHGLLRRLGLELLDLHLDERVARDTEPHRIEAENERRERGGDPIRRTERDDAALLPLCNLTSEYA
jgi:hypothetical protein